MNQSYIPLIEAWETYLREENNMSLLSFGEWLVEKERKDKENADNDLNNYFNQNTDEYNFFYQSPEASFLIWRLSKFIRHYVKPILSENGLSSPDDFAILAHVDYLKTCSKKEALEANIIEISTGIEMIKRLIKQDLLTEKENEEDKRQKLISLTPKGQKLLQNIYISFSNIQDLLMNMPNNERVNLITILKNLDEFHTKNIKELNR